MIVGVGDYAAASSWPRLPNASADADGLASELEQRYGFAVTALRSPTLGTFKAALRELATRAGPADDVVVFFAGHGYFDSDDNAGYLVLSDATKACVSNCYAFDNLKRALYGIHARHVLVMIDACHAGTFDVRAALDSGELREAADRPVPTAEQMLEVVQDYARYPSRLFLASVANAPTTDGAPGAHSPFMSAVLRELGRPGPSGVVSLDRLFLALGEDAALPVVRPLPFSSIVPHHPNGTFLFIEDVPFCAALQTVVRAAAHGFDGIRGETERRESWATTSASRWLVPGTRRCDIWHWEAGGNDQLRCELGPWDAAMGGAKASDIFAQARKCFGADSATTESERDHAGRHYHDWRLALPDGRSVTATTVCADSCEVALVVE
ncbi:MAG: caspase family protein [Myxococcota bacterium]